MPYQYTNFDKAANHSLKTFKRVQKFYTKQNNSSQTALLKEKSKKKCRLVANRSTINPPKKNTVALGIAINSTHPVANVGVPSSHRQSGIEKQTKNKANSIIQPYSKTKEQPTNKLDVARGQFDTDWSNGNGNVMISKEQLVIEFQPLNKVNKEVKLLAPPPSPIKTGAEHGNADKLMASLTISKQEANIHSTIAIDELLAATFQRLLTIAPLEQSSFNLVGGDCLQSNHSIPTLDRHKEFYKRRREIPFVSIQPDRNPIRKKFSKSGKRNA